MTDDHPSPNFDERPEGAAIDMLVLHYTGMESGEAALARMCDPAAKVSAHYLIDEDGSVTRLVDEGGRAWHAGVSLWRGNTDINARSIGIELVNPGHEFGYRDFSGPQMTSLKTLALDVVSRHAIPAANVVGHSDIAPRRKLDPGERFDWAGLAADGIGVWPGACDPVEADEETIVKWLSAYGYDIAYGLDAITAFQRHFRPARIDGVADGETAGLLKALLEAENTSV